MPELPPGVTKKDFVVGALTQLVFVIVVPLLAFIALVLLFG